MNKFYAIGIICITVTIFYGFSSLSYKTNTLIEPDAYCCEGGECETGPPAKTNCNSKSSAHIWITPWRCEEITITCRECVYATVVSKTLCKEGGSYKCWDAELGEWYYGWPSK